MRANQGHKIVMDNISIPNCGNLVRRFITADSPCISAFMLAGKLFDANRSKGLSG